MPLFQPRGDTALVKVHFATPAPAPVHSDRVRYRDSEWYSGSAGVELAKGDPRNPVANSILHRDDGA